jgi:hypothetical protein
MRAEGPITLLRLNGYVLQWQIARWRFGLSHYESSRGVRVCSAFGLGPLCIVWMVA